MIFFTGVFLSTLGFLGTVSGDTRALQLDDFGLFEVGAATVNYDAGTGDTSLTLPTLVVVFEHDDVTNADTNAGNAAYGTVEVKHYQSGCTTEIVSDGLTSAMGEVVTAPGVLGDEPLATEPTWVYTDSVQTTILYQVSALDSLDFPIRTVLNDDVTIAYCVRLSLLDTTGAEMGYREVDITATYTESSSTGLTVTTTEDGTTSGGATFGSFSAAAELCVTDPVQPSPFAQGDSIKLCFYPENGAGVDTTEVDIISVDDFVFFLDTIPNDLFDAGSEVGQWAIQDGAVNGPTTFDYACGDDVDGGTKGTYGCVLTITLGPEFFSGSLQTVKGRGLVTLEFDGARRQLQINPGDQGQVTMGTEIQIQGTGEGDSDSGWCGDCSGVFCWITSIICFILSIFGL